jgi:hypothetical protein
MSRGLGFDDGGKDRTDYEVLVYIGKYTVTILQVFLLPKPYGIRLKPFLYLDF